MLFSRKKPTTVRVRGTNLVASFPSANPALLWKFDLERNHSFTLALEGDDSDWELGVTSPKGEFYPIAHFPIREDAEEAFAKIGKALARGRRGWGWRLLRFIGFLALAIMLVIAISWILISGLMPNTSHIAGLNAPNLWPQTGSQMPGLTPPFDPAHAPSGAPAAPADIPSGIPLPADDVLRPPH